MPDLWLWIAAAVLGTASWWWIWVGMDSPRVQEFQVALGTFLLRIWRWFAGTKVS